MARFLSQILIGECKLRCPSPSFPLLSSGLLNLRCCHSNPGAEGEGDESSDLQAIRSAKRLEDAINNMIVRSYAPYWLPFFPGSSYWVPPDRVRVRAVKSTMEQKVSIENTMTEEEEEEGKLPIKSTKTEEEKEKLSNKVLITPEIENAMTEEEEEEEEVSADNMLITPIENTLTEEENLSNKGLITPEIENTMTEEENVLQNAIWMA